MPEPTADPVAAALKMTPATNAVRADVWDAYYQSGSAEEFAAKLENLSLPKPIKAYLWDLKSGKSDVAPPWQVKHPVMAEVARQTLNALPGVGAVVGGMVAAPETLGMGSVMGAALGAGAGRGVRDLATERLGLESETGPVEKAANIGADVALTAVLPGAVEAAKTPLQTLSESATAFRNSLPWVVKKILPNLDALRVPKAMTMGETLTKPAWQNRMATEAVEHAKPKFDAIDVKRIKMIMEQGVSQQDAVKFIQDLKAKGGMR